MAYFETPSRYIETSKSLKDKISRLNVVIEGLEDAAIQAAGKGHVAEYEIDDGQSRIRTKYRSLTEIFQAIKDLERLRQMYINRNNRNGVVTLKDLNSQC